MSRTLSREIGNYVARTFVFTTCELKQIFCEGSVPAVPTEAWRKTPSGVISTGICVVSYSDEDEGLSQVVTYLLIISLHNRGLQAFFFFVPFISDWVELFTLEYFYLPITVPFFFFFLSEEMPVFGRLETNDSTFQIGAGAIPGYTVLHINWVLFLLFCTYFCIWNDWIRYLLC